MKGMGNYMHQSLVYAAVYQRCKRARDSWHTALMVAVGYPLAMIPLILVRDKWTPWNFVVPALITIVVCVVAYAFYRRMVRAQRQLDSLTESSGIGRLWDDL
jgi:membrane protein implicated in regulation of membrane protease activity